MKTKKKKIKKGGSKKVNELTNNDIYSLDKANKEVWKNVKVPAIKKYITSKQGSYSNITEKDELINRAISLYHSSLEKEHNSIANFYNQDKLVWENLNEKDQYIVDLLNPPKEIKEFGRIIKKNLEYQLFFVKITSDIFNSLLSPDQINEIKEIKENIDQEKLIYKEATLQFNKRLSLLEKEVKEIETNIRNLNSVKKELRYLKINIEESDGFKRLQRNLKHIDEIRKDMEHLEIQNKENINDFREQLKNLEIKHILNIKDVYNLIITNPQLDNFHQRVADKIDKGFYYVIIERNRLRKSV